MITIIRNAEVHAPAPLGRRDVVLAGEKIVGVSEPGVEINGLDVEVIDAAGRALTPGFIDNHVHVLGGGGGLGMASRAPELQTSQLVRTGTTAVIGMLGFDATTKNMEALIAKTKAFREDGISAYCLTGATLEHPVPTFTGRIRTDIVFVEEIIGVGEISISELGYGYDSFGAGAQYIAEVAVAGLLAGRLTRKAGFLCLQVPPYLSQVLKPMFEVVEQTGIPITQFIPSHVNQTPQYLEDAKEWGKRGGWLDVGANYAPDNGYDRATDPVKAITSLVESGVPIERILISSDGNGAPPKEEKGENKPRRANYMPVSRLMKTWRRLVAEEGFSMADALGTVTSNVAQATGLTTKGQIAVDMDADLILFDDGWEIHSVFARGQRMVAEGRLLRRGMFDQILLDQLA